MAPEICNAMDLWIGKTRWSVIIQVIHRYPTQNSKNQQKLRKYIFTDMQGTIIGAIMYGQTVPLFENLLQPYKRYKISNARIDKVLDKYRISEYDYSWTISNRTPVELLDDPNPYPLPYLPTVPISSLQQYAGKDISINIGALVVQRLPPTQQTTVSPTKNYVLLTKEKLPIILTLWMNTTSNNNCLIDDDIELPKFIIGMNLKVTTFHGLSLTTKKFAHVMINPPIPAAQEMLEWYNSSSDHQALWKHHNIYHNVQRFFTLTPNTDVLNIKTAKQELPNLHTAWVKGSLEYVPTEKSPWCVICGYCTKIVDADPGYIMTCTSCNQKEATIVGSNLTFKFFDKTDNMLIISQYPVVNDVVDITLNEIKTLAEQEKLWNVLDEMLENKTFICFINYFFSNFNQRKIHHYSVLKFFKLQNQSSHAPNISSLNASSSALEVETMTGPHEDSTTNTPPSFATMPDPINTSKLVFPSTTKRLQFESTSKDLDVFGKVASLSPADEQEKKKAKYSDP